MNYLQKKKKAMLNYVSGGRLPSEYQEVEWVGADGNQYINTLITPKSTQEYYIKYQILWGGNQVYFGSRTSGGYESSRNQVFLNPNVSTVGLRLGSMYSAVRSFDAVTVYEDTINHTDYPSNYDDTGTRPFYLFALNVGSANAKARGRIFAFTITNNGVKELEFIPCYRKSDDVIGMYDTVTQTFYTNSGTGTFTKGQDV